MTEALIDPVVFNPYDYHFHDDPYPTYKRLREESPCITIRTWAFGHCRDMRTWSTDSRTTSVCRAQTEYHSTPLHTVHTRIM